MPIFDITEFLSLHSLLSSSRDSTYREDDCKNIEDQNTNGTGTLAKSSSCSSFIIDILFRGIRHISKKLAFSNIKVFLTDFE